MSENDIKAKFEYKGIIYIGTYSNEALIFMIPGEDVDGQPIAFRFNGKTIEEAIEKGIVKGHKISKC